MGFYIGVDLGTSNIKAVALDENGMLLGHASRASTTLHPAVDCAEQDPETIWGHFVAVVLEVFQSCKDQGPLIGIAFSAAMHGLIAVDKHGKPLTNAWIWSDLRSQKLVQQMQGNAAGSLLWNTTGTPIHPMSPFFKIQWMKENMPHVFAQAHKFVGIKAYLWHKLFQEYVSDYSVTSATGLMDIRKIAWSETALEKCGCTTAQLPELVPPTYHKLLTHAQFAGLPAGTPVVIGGSDGALANLGAGDDGKSLVMTIGTSAALRAFADQPILPKIEPNFCYLLEKGTYVIGGASNNGGNVLEWMRSGMFACETDMATFVAAAEKAPAGSEGLFFLPYIHGERAPLWDATAQGAFLGIKPWHTRGHFIRAAMEGVIFNLKRISEPLLARGQYDKILISGGFAQNALWVKMVANIFGMPIILPAGAEADASAVGAIKMCAKALGTSFHMGMDKSNVILADVAEQQQYVKAYAQYTQLDKNMAHFR